MDMTLKKQCARLEDAGWAGMRLECGDWQVQGVSGSTEMSDGFSVPRMQRL